MTIGLVQASSFKESMTKAHVQCCTLKVDVERNGILNYSHNFLLLHVYQLVILNFDVGRS